MSSVKHITMCGGGEHCPGLKIPSHRSSHPNSHVHCTRGNTCDGLRPGQPPCAFKHKREDTPCRYGTTCRHQSGAKACAFKHNVPCNRGKGCSNAFCIWLHPCRGVTTGTPCGGTMVIHRGVWSCLNHLP